MIDDDDDYYYWKVVVFIFRIIIYTLVGSIKHAYISALLN